MSAQVEAVRINVNNNIQEQILSQDRAGSNTRQEEYFSIQNKKRYATWCKITLRGAKYYIFLEKLIKIVIHIRDFKGISETLMNSIAT
jgi:ribosomal protein L5